MIEFHCNRRDSYGNPIVYNKEIWEYAEALVGDYKPALLEKPAAINPVHFVESYLGATVEYQNIYFEEHTSPVAGATVFNDDVVKVFDRERMCTKASLHNVTGVQATRHFTTYELHKMVNLRKTKEDTYGKIRLQLPPYLSRLQEGGDAFGWKR